MTAELLRSPDKLDRLWDKDFNLVYTFAPDEDSHDLPLDHPVTQIVFEACDKSRRLYLTSDANGARWSGTLHSFEVHRLYPGGPKRLRMSFMDHFTAIRPDGETAR